MATASPTPLAIHRDTFPRRPPSRPDLRQQPSRPRLKRGSPLSSLVSHNNGPLRPEWNFSIGDSSDDEVPVPPMVFSAEAKAILGDEASESEQPSLRREEEMVSTSAFSGKPKQMQRHSPSLRAERGIRGSSPSSQLQSAFRIVRLSPRDLSPKDGSAGRLRRSATTTNMKASPAPKSQDMITPAPRPRSVQVYTSNGSNGGHSDSARLRTARSVSENEALPIEPRTALRDADISEAAEHIENVSINRLKSDDHGPQGSLRIKRVGKVTGRFLSGPARRGMKRRQSDEDQSPLNRELLSSAGALHESVESQNGSLDQAGRSNVARAESPQPVLESSHRPQSSHVGTVDHVSVQNPINLLDGSPMQDQKPKALHNEAPTTRRPSPPLDFNAPQPKPVQPVFKVPPLPPLPSRFDQENEPPPTFKRNLQDKPRPFSVMADQKKLAQTPGTRSPKRHALAPRSQNTPMRPAPPPPKMTVLETATAPAGSVSASQNRKKRNYISVNGKLFTRMDCIGRGGSSKVYRVMAENFKVFALKRVTLEDQDEAAIRGYKGEIDLLKRLENVERVVRLFDYELNEEKQTLSVLMEMGESDLNRVLTQRLNADEASFDVTFTRYFWKEMLECVQAVHQYDIVHSDLKPANFLLLQGKLKLIDFGISNAIQDNTINVHREQHIGTPNYMSPEALIDSNAASGLPANVGKLMKLGKPSDVWSLGCILYQMTYGKPPFAHIANQMQRIMAIPNPNHIIDFPANGVGNVPIASSLIKTLRRCLNRDQSQRPTVTEMLGPSDPFLNPDSPAQGTVPVSQELLARLQHNIIKHVKEKGMPTDVEMAGWPARFFVSIKAAVEEGRA